MSGPSEKQQLEFLSNVQRVLAEGQFVATYKFALLMALVDLSFELGDDSGDPLEIPSRAIAEKFIEYYWRQASPYEGIILSQLPLLALKELVDNSFDYDGATLESDLDTITISDEGPGLSQSEIERLFSINRPMTSSKRWRRGGRGALGDGLRVACAAIHVLGGELLVASRDGMFSVGFDEIGCATAKKFGPRSVGTVSTKLQYS